jgi:hypothetical protein
VASEGGVRRWTTRKERIEARAQLVEGEGQRGARPSVAVEEAEAGSLMGTPLQSTRRASPRSCTDILHLWYAVKLYAAYARKAGIPPTSTHCHSLQVQVMQRSNEN